MGKKWWLMGRRVGAGVLRGVDLTRRIVLNLVFVAVVVVAVVAALSGGAGALQDKTVLVLELKGALVEQYAGGARATALGQLRDDDSHQTRLRDVVAALKHAAVDPQIERVLLLTEELSSGGLSSQRAVAQALERFKASGKQVVAWSTRYDQRQFYIASHASEVFMHPMGEVALMGYGPLRNYYRDALDRWGVSANVVRVGQYKNAAEPFFSNAPSKQTEESDAALSGELWRLYTQGVEKARKLPAGSVGASIAQWPASLQSVQGHLAQWAVQARWIDGLKTRDEVRKILIERGAADVKGQSFRQVRLDDYLSRIKPSASGDAVGVIVAEGEIGEGTAPSGNIGGRSTADLVRQAREDERIKAVVLRVNSPGGSALGSELIRRELELTRQSGKPVVVSMGDVAASGGYWISLAADELLADEATITGSIGVFGMLPTAEGLMDKASVRVGGQGTTWLTHAYDLRKPLDPRFREIVEMSIGHIYTDFIGKVAAARKSTPDKVDAVAQGRVWTGTQALSRGLIDRHGQLTQAIEAAAQRAKLPAEHAVRWIERDRGKLDQLLGFFKAELRQALGVSSLSGPWGMATAAAQAPGEVLQPLWWMHEVAQRRAPFAAVVHCMCAAP